jgi:DNA-binding NarL/FixJ family response regulator
VICADKPPACARGTASRAARSTVSGSPPKSISTAQPADASAIGRSVAEGEALLAPAITRRLIERFVSSPQLPTEPPELGQLSQRERDALLRLARGRSNAEIARELFVSEATVKTHVAGVLRKLDLRDRVQAVLWAYETGFVRPGETDGG